MIRSIKAWVQQQAFDPTLTGVFVNPFFLTRRALVAAMRLCAPYVQGRVLDVGCGQKPYLPLFSSTEYVGLEIDTPSNRANKRADYFYDGASFPFGDGEFDVVLCNQVLEHVFDPERFVSELHRVVRSGGVLLLTVPFVWDEHEQPFDYARYSSYGLRHLVGKHGFVIEKQVKTCNDVSVLFQLWNAYIYKVLRPNNRYLELIVTAVMMAPVSILGLLAGRILPGNDDLYLDNVIIARKSSRPAEGA